MSTSAQGWTAEIEVGGRPGHDAVTASLLALSDGSASVVGDLGSPDSPPLVLAAGCYGRARDGIVRPLPAPVWSPLESPDESARRWRIDLRTGVLSRRSSAGDSCVTRFQSIARPGIGATRVDLVDANAGAVSGPAPTSEVGLRPPVASPLAAEFEFTTRDTTRGGVARAATVSDRSAVTLAVADRRAPEERTVDRFVAVHGASTVEWDEATRAAVDARGTGFDALLQQHCDAWDARWHDADVEICGDPDAQLAVRYALFHLLSCATPSNGESPVGARGLTGLAYAGHVFWDTEVFVLPALAATSPSAARSILEYRLRRIGAAEAAAMARGAPGIRFPWESADDGSDVTPTSAVGTDGTVIPIVTGAQAEHINSDIAWALLHYVDWTGDTSVLDGGGRDVVVGTAEYLTARARVDAGGAAHIDGVVGPDEYHEGVDDNAYTNGMVRWHLRRAASLVGNDPARARRFTALADALVTGFHPELGRHEQSAGFWNLDDVLIGRIATPPVAADVLLGRDRVSRSQIVKQPDVLMLHHVLPDECPADSLAADLDYYLPRTAHGSSLSPAICASLLARSGRPDDAMEWFDVAARLDLDDLTGTTAGGLHLATMGGLWQALAWGFAGIRPTPQGLRIDPALPARWSSLAVTVVVRGQRVRVVVDHDRVAVDSAQPIQVIIGGQASMAPTCVPRHADPRTVREVPMHGGAT